MSNALSQLWQEAKQAVGKTNSEQKIDRNKPLTPQKVAWMLKKAGFDAAKEGTGWKSQSGRWHTVGEIRSGFRVQEVKWTESDSVGTVRFRVEHIGRRTSRSETRSMLERYCEVLIKSGLAAQVKEYEHISSIELCVYGWAS